MKKYINNIKQFINSFICIVSAIMIICAEFITEKLTIAKYLERNRDGIIYHIIISIFMIIFAIPIIFMRYLSIDIHFNEIFENRRQVNK